MKIPFGDKKTTKLYSIKTHNTNSTKCKLENSFLAKISSPTSLPPFPKNKKKP
jgi:hypothetical protein